MNKRKLNDRQGFTIMELLVSTGILFIITALILAKFPNFDDNVSLKKTAQDVALEIRQAQSYGLSVKESQAGSGKYPGYGVHFDISSPASFILFADVNGNNAYDAGESIETVQIQTGEKISQICINVKSSPPGSCGFNGTEFGTADIIFLRPNPLTILEADGYSSSDIEIKIISPRGQTKTVVILSTGQVSVE